MVWPGRRTTKAVTISPQSSSGTPATAPSATAGWRWRTTSTSSRCDRLAAGADHVLHPPDDSHVALVVALDEVPGAVPAVDHDRLGGLGVAEVTEEGLGALHPQLAVLEADVQPRDGQPDRPGLRKMSRGGSWQRPPASVAP